MQTRYYASMARLSRPGCNHPFQLTLTSIWHSYFTLLYVTHLSDIIFRYNVLLQFGDDYNIPSRLPTASISGYYNNYRQLYKLVIDITFYPPPTYLTFCCTVLLSYIHYWRMIRLLPTHYALLIENIYLNRPPLYSNLLYLGDLNKYNQAQRRIPLPG